VAITGTGFSTTPGATTVAFGPSAASGVSCATTTSCSATSPAGSGTVDVRVTVGGQTSPPGAADQFTYQTIITFDDLASPNRPLTGIYGGIDWGTYGWYLSAPWGSFSTNSISFPAPGPTAEGFAFVAPQTLLSIEAYNGGTVASTVTLTCSGNPTVTRTVAVGQTLTIATGWSAACVTVTVGSSNGWDTNFDNVTYR
jgi:hypothetical protein